MKTSPKTVLVIYKKSQYEIYVKERKNPRISSLIKEGSEVTKGMLKSHEEHNLTLEHVLSSLQKLELKVSTAYRANAEKVLNHDMVVTVGGDGTLLWAQKFIGADIPVLGVNSDPERSVGALTCTNRSHFIQTMQDYLEGTRGAVKNNLVQRIAVKVDGTEISSRVLNDVLFSHVHPAGTSSYIIKDPGPPEAQKSSGIWVSTAIGSTGVMKSAGGNIMPFHGELLQWKVREAFEPAFEYRLKHKNITKGSCLEVVSKMREGIISMDGTSSTKKVEMGQTIVFEHGEPLTVVKKS